MMMILLMSMITPLLMPFVVHPLSLGCLLLIQTLIISLITGMMGATFWYSYIMFLIMVGGMLILFMYMTNVASNEKFKLSLSMFSVFTLIMLFIPMLTLLDHWMLLKSNWIIDQINSLNILISLSKFLNFPGIISSTGLIIYLLITLVAVIEIVKIKYGPLRNN
nr:NADH dehydrogenase subunit 6 [Homoderus mellyi]